MTDLKSMTPLGDHQARIDAIGQLTISERPDRALASVTARKGQSKIIAKTVHDALGIDLPGPGRCRTDGDYTTWWMGPDQWMVDADHTQHEWLAAEITRAVGPVASVTEQTDGWCRFDIRGTTCAALLERLCPVDAHAMQPGQATRTLLHHLGCFVICSTTGFSVLGPRSSAGSLHHALCAAAQSIR